MDIYQILYYFGPDYYEIQNVEAESLEDARNQTSLTSEWIENHKGRPVYINMAHVKSIEVKLHKTSQPKIDIL